MEDIQNMHSKYLFILSLVQSSRIETKSDPEEHTVLDDEQRAK